MGCGAVEATGLGFFCFVVINPCVVSCQPTELFWVDFGLFCFISFPILLPPPSLPQAAQVAQVQAMQQQTSAAAAAGTPMIVGEGRIRHAESCVYGINIVL